MDFLKELLKPFFEFDEYMQKKDEAKAKTSPSEKPEQQADTISDEVTHPLINERDQGEFKADKIPTYTPTGVLDKPLAEHIEYFEQLIDSANTTNPAFNGADYKEFIDNKFDIDDIADEALKYKTAFNVLKASGLTKAKLLQTGQEYVEIIGRDLNNFQGAQSAKYRKALGPKEVAVQKKAEELLALQQKVNKLKSEINTLTQDVNLAKDQMNTIRNSFLLAGEMKQNEIANELKKIDQYFE